MAVAMRDCTAGLEMAPKLMPLMFTMDFARKGLSQ